MNAVEHIAENAAGGYPPHGYEVQILKRRRGAPLGNRNRLIHGCYSRERLERRAEVMALVRATNRMIVRLKMVGRMRKAVFARRLRAQPAANPPIPVLRALTTAFRTRESWLTWQMARAPPLIRMC